MSIFDLLFSKKHKKPKEPFQNEFDKYALELDKIANLRISALMNIFTTQYNARRSWKGELSASVSFKIHRGVWDSVLNNSNGISIKCDCHEPMFRFGSGESTMSILRTLPLYNEHDDKYFWEACAPYFKKHLEQQAKCFFLPSDSYHIYVSEGNSSIYVGISAHQNKS